MYNISNINWKYFFNIAYMLQSKFKFEMHIFLGALGNICPHFINNKLRNARVGDWACRWNVTKQDRLGESTPAILVWCNYAMAPFIKSRAEQMYLKFALCFIVQAILQKTISLDCS